MVKMVLQVKGGMMVLKVLLVKEVKGETMVKKETMGQLVLEANRGKGVRQARLVLPVQTVRKVQQVL